MKVIYGTTNENKLKEIKNYFKDYDMEVVSLKDIGFDKEIVEDGDTFLANSLIKAKAINEYCHANNINSAILTDDAGLCVHSLDDRPGVHTARYAGDHAPQLVALNKLLEELKNCDDRSATFYCALTFVWNDEYIQVLGHKDGTISKTIGKLGGFTFGPVFIPKGYDRPYNELDNFETHRHNAFNLLIDELKRRQII